MMLDVTGSRVDGVRFTKEEREDRIEAAGGRRARAPKAEHEHERGEGTPSGSRFAVVEMRGVLARHADLMMDYSGGTSTSEFASCIRAAGADANVKGILIFADTPGGTVDGTKEAADAVAEVVADGKPVVVYAENMLASGGCWIGFQASEVYAAPYTMVGSLGVRMQHLDVSKADEENGLKYTFVTYPIGGNKAEGNPHEPLADETLKHYQDLIRPAGEAFYAAVAAGRRVPLARVNDWGQGRVFDASDAERLGMIDGVTTFEGALARLETLSGATATGQEDEKMASPGEDPQTAAASALRESLQPGGLLAAELAPLKAGIEALTKQGTEILAAHASLEQKLEATGKEALKDRVSAFVEARIEAGQIPVGEKEAEVGELLELSAERREARMARLSARSGKVPTRAKVEDGTAAVPVVPSGVFAGFNVIPGEAEAIAQAKAEGFDPTKDAAAFVARVEELRAEGEADA